MEDSSYGVGIKDSDAFEEEEALIDVSHENGLFLCYHLSPSQDFCSQFKALLPQLQ